MATSRRARSASDCPFSSAAPNSVTMTSTSLRAVVTGKTLACGGSAGREKATAQGVLHCITEWAREQRFELEGRTAIIQGFGNVGSHAGVLLAKLGVSIVGVGDHTGYLHSGEGFNVHKLQDRCV